MSRKWTAGVVLGGMYSHSVLPCGMKGFEGVLLYFLCKGRGVSVPEGVVNDVHLSLFIDCG